MLRVLVELYREEREPERDRRQEQHDARPRLPARSDVNADATSVAAHEEDGRVDRAERLLGVLEPDVEPARVLESVDGVEREEAGEEEHLAREEDPHPEARGVGLLLERSRSAPRVRDARCQASSRARSSLGHGAV